MHYPENNKLPMKDLAGLSLAEFRDVYFDSKRPESFVTTFKDNAEFRQWCEEGSKEDLRCTLKAFEDAELYEYCVIINEVLKAIA
jgi:hypothetical protein